MEQVIDDNTRDDWLAWPGRVDATLPHLATKADLERLRAELHALMWKLAGLYLAGLLALFAALRWLH